jgi:glycosyltransferase involved in cell wall biosynthesis
LRQADGCNIFRWANSVLDIDDIPSSISQGNFTQARPISEMFFHARQILNWRRREKILLERFTSICVCSEPDRLKLGGAPEIFVVPNGFSISTKNIARELFSPPRIGFVGTLGYEPNRSGLNWFLQRVWPLILRAAPQTRLRVAGEAPDFLKNARFQNVDRLGWLPDVETEMSTWSHTIVPLFIGGGTRIKIAEAFSRKCPVVSTTVGAYGYNVRDGQQILLADRPKEFASKCLWILENPNESKIIAENARQKFLANWTWDVIGDQVVKVAESVLQKNRRVETFSADVNV